MSHKNKMIKSVNGTYLWVIPIF